MQDVANNLFFAYNLSNFLTKFEKLWTTWGTFVGFLPVVGLANLIEILYSALCEVIAKFYVL